MDKRALFQQQEKTASRALPSREEMPELIHARNNECTKNGGKTQKQQKCYFSKYNPPHMKYCFGFNHAIIVNVVQNF